MLSIGPWPAMGNSLERKEKGERGRSWGRGLRPCWAALFSASTLCLCVRRRKQQEGEEKKEKRKKKRRKKWEKFVNMEIFGKIKR
jgi:hypothetical protein